MSESLRERFDLTRDEERHLEVLSLFRTGGSEGCHKVFLGPAARTMRARRDAVEFGWCGACRQRAARPGRTTCPGCARQRAGYQRTDGREKHNAALSKSNAKIRTRLQKLGICTGCRKLPARPNRVDCQSCTDKAEARRLARRDQLRRQTGLTP